MHRIFNTRCNLIVAVFLILLILGTGRSSALMIDLTIPKSSGMPEMLYATVSGEVDGGDNSIFHFTVNLAPGLSMDLNGGNNFGIDQFFFNTSLDLTNDMITAPSGWKIFYDKNVAGFGRFDLKLAGGGNQRIEDVLSFDIDFSSPVTENDFFLLSEGNADNGNGHYALHIGGFDFDGFGSVFVRDGTPVPEPASLLLLGGGLIGLIAVRRRP